MKVAKSLEIDTIEYLKTLNYYKDVIDKLKKDLSVHSAIISRILKLHTKTYEGKEFLEFEKILKICEEEFKKIQNSKG
jgi:hypothetical protein